MASFSNIPTTAAILTATRGMRGRSSGDAPEDIFEAFMIVMGGICGLFTLILVWLIATSYIGKPEYTHTTVGTITSIEARAYKSTFYYAVTTSEGYSLDFYRDKPILGETVYKDVIKRKFQREVSYTVHSGGSTGYKQIWPFMKED
jgi:hypothetical protein